MKPSPEERAARREAFRKMGVRERLEYIVAYYKFPVLSCLLALVLLGSALRSAWTKKEVLLYLGYCNVSLGEDLRGRLEGDYVVATGRESGRQEVYVYTDLYLSDAPLQEYHEYAYASRMKLMAAVNAGNLDAILMNRESYDLLSGQGYLLPLPDWLSQNAPALHEQLVPYYVENSVVLEDNGIEYRLNEAEEHRVVEAAAVNGLALYRLPVCAEAGLSGEVYFGVIANSRRLPELLGYLEYLVSGDFSE